MDMAEKDATEGRCPACRTPYDKDRIVEANFQRVAGNSSSRKQKVQKPKPKLNEGRKDLSNVRVIQRKMAYIIGLPLELADEDLLQQKDYFGQYGKVTKVSLSRTAGGTLQQFVNDTCSVYITYSKEEEAVTCIQSVHGYVLDGRLLKASFGTAKYCHAWLRNTPCNNPTCLYLHTIGAEEDSFGKDEVAAVHTRNRVQEIVGATQYLHRRLGSMLPPPVVEQSNNYSASAEESVCNDGFKDVVSGDHLPCSKDKDAPAKLSKQTTFVDIIGRSSSLKDVNSVEEEEWMFNVSSDVETETVLLKSSPTFDDQISKESSSHNPSFVPSHSVKWNTEYYNQRIGGEHTALNSFADKEKDTIAVSPFMDSALNDGFNENKFQSSAKSDMIYRGSNSFSNEEIVEHLRRLDHDDTPVNDDDDAALEKSIISNILSMGLDGDDLVYPQTMAGVLEAREGQYCSSWNCSNNDQSRFSFAKEHGYFNYQNDLAYPSTTATRAQNLTPPGFSMASKPPPGFSTACLRPEQAIGASSGGGKYMRSAPNSHYRSPSLGNLSNSSDDFIVPAATGLTNSWTTSFSSSSFDEDTKNWPFMQQPGPATSLLQHQEPQFSQTTMQHHYTPQFPSSRDDLFGGLTSGLMDIHQQSYNPSSLFNQQPKFAVAGGYHQQHSQLQGEVQQHEAKNGYLECKEYMHLHNFV